jgi:hypothetical protein
MATRLGELDGARGGRPGRTRISAGPAPSVSLMVGSLLRGGSWRSSTSESDRTIGTDTLCRGSVSDTGRKRKECEGKDKGRETHRGRAVGACGQRHVRQLHRHPCHRPGPAGLIDAIVTRERQQRGVRLTVTARQHDREWVARWRTVRGELRPAMCSDTREANERAKGKGNRGRLTGLLTACHSHVSFLKRETDR